MSHLRLVHDASRAKDLAAARDQLPTFVWGAVIIATTVCGLGYVGLTAYGLVQSLHGPWSALSAVNLGFNVAMWIGLSVWIARLFGPNPFVPRAPDTGEPEQGKACAYGTEADPGFFTRLAWTAAALALPLPTLALLCIRNASRRTRMILAAMALFTFAVLVLSVLLVDRPPEPPHPLSSTHQTR
ncbi:MAG: hypothetical protein JNM23_04725 [Bradyrhizobiaceae bacterium]|nr:hypothetical protein [Bradyrhizobiaceae bacterium]